MASKCPACGRHKDKVSENAKLCSDCDVVYANLKTYCGTLVSTAIKTGRLPSPKGMLCKDCGGKADRYDHRYYSIPLEVDAVCRACNWKRGSAKDSLDMMRDLIRISRREKIATSRLRTLLKLLLAEQVISRQRVHQVLSK